MFLEKLLRIVTPVGEDDQGFRAWSEQSSFLDLLAEQRKGASTILYGSSFNHGSLLIQSILVPIEDLKSVPPEDMMQGNWPLAAWSCGLVYGGAVPRGWSIASPSKALSQVVFSGASNLCSIDPSKVAR